MAETAARPETVIDPIALRRAFGTFVTGVTVITTLDEDGTPRGMTANSFTSVSLDPPLLLVCVGKSASSYPAFTAAPAFAVNLLHEGQVDVREVAGQCARDQQQAVPHALRGVVGFARQTAVYQFSNAETDDAVGNVVHRLAGLGWQPGPQPRSPRTAEIHAESPPRGR